MTVSTSNWSDSLSEVPFQLRVTEEPPVTNQDQLPPSDEANPQWQKMAPSGDAPELVAGTSFADAPELTPGSYTVDVMPGEIQLFRVPAEWGQRIQAQVRMDPLSKAESKAAGNDRWYELDVLSPQGAAARALFTDGDPPESKAMVNEKGSEVGVITKEVRWTNRDGCCDDNLATTLAGDYYLTLRLDKTTDKPESFALPMTLTVDVTGEAGAGAPEYGTSGGEPTPTQSPSDPEPPATPRQSATPSGEDVEEPPADEGRPWGLIGGLTGGAVVLAGLGAGGFWWLKRR